MRQTSCSRLLILVHSLDRLMPDTPRTRFAGGRGAATSCFRTRVELTTAVLHLMTATLPSSSENNEPITVMIQRTIP